MNHDHTRMGSGPCIEAEGLAAFMEGRLEGEDRARVLDHLEHCEDCYEIVAGALATEQELEAEDAETASVDDRSVAAEPAGVSTGPPPRIGGSDSIDEVGGGESSDRTVGAGSSGRVVPIDRGRSVWRPALALAAAAAFAAILLPGVRDAMFGGGARSAGELARELSSESGDLSNLAWDSDDGRWSRIRSESDGLDERARSFRLGVRSTDFELALATSDKVRASTHLAEMLRLIRRQQLLAGEDGEYEELEDDLLGEDGEDLSRIAERSASLEPSLSYLGPPGWYELGRDFEALRVAATLGDDRFLRRRGRSISFETVRSSKLSPAVSGALGRVEAALQAEPLDREALLAALDGAVSRLGNR